MKKLATLLLGLFLILSLTSCNKDSNPVSGTTQSWELTYNSGNKEFKLYMLNNTFHLNDSLNKITTTDYSQIKVTADIKTNGKITGLGEFATKWCIFGIHSYEYQAFYKTDSTTLFNTWFNKEWITPSPKTENKMYYVYLGKDNNTYDTLFIYVKNINIYGLK